MIICIYFSAIYYFDYFPPEHLNILENFRNHMIEKLTLNKIFIDNKALRFFKP